MDSLQRRYARFFSLEDVAEYVSGLGVPDFKNNKHIEIFTGCLFLIAINKNNRKIHAIGFPSTEEMHSKYPETTLESMIHQQLYIDKDIDLFLSPEDNLTDAHALQVTEFRDPSWDGSADGLIQFLSRKKFKVASDPNLALLVLLYRDSKNVLSELNSKLKEMISRVPYGQIFILNLEKPEEFNLSDCWQVFPDLKKIADFSLTK